MRRRTIRNSASIFETAATMLLPLTQPETWQVLLASLLAGLPNPAKPCLFHVSEGFQDLHLSQDGGVIARAKTTQKKRLEARMGVEPTNGGFADPFETLSSLFSRAIPSVLNGHIGPRGIVSLAGLLAGFQEDQASQRLWLLLGLSVT